MPHWGAGVRNVFRRLLSALGRDRRWISDREQRDHHEAIVRRRLPNQPPVPLAEAAERLGVSTQTVRRRVKRGKLRAEYDARGRISGVYLHDDEGRAE